MGGMRGLCNKVRVFRLGDSVEQSVCARTLDSQAYTCNVVDQGLV